MALSSPRAPPSLAPPVALDLDALSTIIVAVVEGELAVAPREVREDGDGARRVRGHDDGPRAAVAARGLEEAEAAAGHVGVADVEHEDRRHAEGVDVARAGRRAAVPGRVGAAVVVAPKHVEAH